MTKSSPSRSTPKLLIMPRTARPPSSAVCSIKPAAAASPVAPSTAMPMDHTRPVMKSAKK
jgi:hypothetical protein